jgi:hypothetical protein
VCEISDIIGEKRQSAPTSLVAGIGPGLTMSFSINQTK